MKKKYKYNYTSIGANSDIKHKLREIAQVQQRTMAATLSIIIKEEHKKIFNKNTTSSI
ncbi:MAG: hypothetical protein K9M56_04395 [Victivallales bacterium]|nr:hypothetical protein [Victivallales bacterium]